MLAIEVLSLCEKKKKTPVDLDLMGQVQMRATGANVHTINGQLGRYRNACYLSDEPKWEKIRQGYENALRAFVATGILMSKAEEDAIWGR